MWEMKKIGMGLLLVGVLIGMGPLALAQTDVLVVEGTSVGVVGVDIAPTLQAKIGANVEAKAIQVNAHAADVRMNAWAGNESNDTYVGVDASTSNVLVRLGISPAQFREIVPTDRRAEFISRILSARAIAIARMEAHAEARADLAERLEERVGIINLTGLDQAIARVTYAHALALREGRTELAAQLELVLLRLQENKDKQEEPNTDDLEEADRRIWQLHSERLLMSAENSIAVALRIDNRLKGTVEKMDTLAARLQNNGRFAVQVTTLAERVSSFEASFEASIQETQTALATFESETSVANARALHAQLVEMNSLARSSGKAIHVYVRLYNYLAHHPRVTANGTVDIAGEVNADAVGVAQAEVDAVMNSSLYGEANVQGSN